MAHLTPSPSTDVAEQVLEGARLPHRLRDLADPPDRVYLRGRLPVGPWVAVVGTRRPSGEAARYAGRLAGELARAGVVVASGGALGIDASAHRGALDAGGHTVVVAPSGWERPYPAEHVGLFRSIVEAGGGHLSSFEQTVAPQRAQFFARNRLLAALCHLLVVVEAGLRSGALNAAKQACRLGRPVYAAPAPPWHPRGAGGTVLLGRGARPLVSSRCVLQALEAAGAAPVSVPRAEPASQLRVGSALERVLASVAAGPRHADQIATDTGLAAAEVSHATLTLTLEGRLHRREDGSFKRSGG